jgi:hypothetical protein
MGSSTGRLRPPRRTTDGVEDRREAARDRQRDRRRTVDGAVSRAASWGRVWPSRSRVGPPRSCIDCLRGRLRGRGPSPGPQSRVRVFHAAKRVFRDSTHSRRGGFSGWGLCWPSTYSRTLPNNVPRLIRWYPGKQSIKELPFLARGGRAQCAQTTDTGAGIHTALLVWEPGRAHRLGGHTLIGQLHPGRFLKQKPQ